jgi:CheY-like chemotaxis protein/mono/diheme cytochrome c family protein
MADDKRSRLEERLQQRRAQAALPVLVFEGDLRLMLVDDEPPNLQALQRLLKSSFTVSTHASGEDALAAVEGGLEPDIVLSDQRMSGMTGVELLGHIAERLPMSMRLILSGYTDRGDLLSAINTGNVDQYVTKPWEATDLISTLQEAVDEYDRRKEEHARQQKELEAARIANALAAVRRKQISAALLGLLVLSVGLTWSLLKAPYDEDGYLLIARHAIDRDWVGQIPDEAFKMTNPEALTDTSIAVGKETYESGCVGCHARDAKGGGPIARLFTIPAGALYEAGDLTLPEGAFVWVVSNGIEGTAMQPMGSLVGDNYWHLANYLRSLAAADSSGTGEPGDAVPAPGG